MGLSINKKKAVLFTDTLIFVLCVVGIFNIIQKADLPIEVRIENSQLIMSANEPKLQFLNDQKLILADNLLIKSVEELEILLDSKKTGNKLEIKYKSNGDILSSYLTLVPFYSLSYILIASFVGIMFFVVALVVFIKCEDREVAWITHWAFIFTAMIIMLTWGNYTVSVFKLGIITRLLFHLAYLFAPLYFLKFALVFPEKQSIVWQKATNKFFIFVILLFLVQSAGFIYLSEYRTIELIRSYIFIFNICSAFIIILIFIAITVFLYSYLTSNEETNRKKLRWILLGFVFGPLGYLLLWVIPSRLTNNPIVSESVILLLVAFVPITFGIAIIKYRLFNVDLIFNRGLVYTFVISTLLIIYTSTLSAAAFLLDDPDSKITSIIAAISIALLFQPVKQKVQKFVDRKFFRIAYDYRIALKTFNNKIKNTYHKEELIEKAILLINDLFNVKHIGFFSEGDTPGSIRLKNHINLSELIEKNIELKYLEKTSKDLLNNLFRKNDRTSVKVKTLSNIIIETKTFSKVIFIESEKKRPYGIIAVGAKKGEINYTLEDIDLLNIISSRIELTLDRIQLQEEIIRKQIEAERLEKLSKEKTYFVSSVSHDLKTPLTSIKMFAEKLRTSDNIPYEKRREYLEIIEGESNRLTRLINNVLDFSKIERNEQQYYFDNVNLVEIVKRVIVSMEYQFKISQFIVKTEFSSNEILIYADEDAVSEALINLLTNAVKFSRKNRSIKVEITECDNNVYLSVLDNGIGVNNDNLENIFKPFFRCKEPEINRYEGAGLGLAIVKHIMNSHNGRIEVNSSKGNGSKFSLVFPLHSKRLE